MKKDIRRYKIHLGLITLNSEKTLSTLLLLGGTYIKAVEDKLRKVMLTFVDLGNVLIEVVEPLDKTSKVYSLAKKGVSFYHICITVHQKLEDYIERLTKFGSFILIEPPSPAIAFDGDRVAFLYNTSIGIIKLREFKTKSGRKTT